MPSFGGFRRTGLLPPASASRECSFLLHFIHSFGGFRHTGLPPSGPARNRGTLFLRRRRCVARGTPSRGGARSRSRARICRYGDGEHGGLPDLDEVPVGERSGDSGYERRTVEEGAIRGA